MKDTLLAMFTGLLKLAIYLPVILILLILKEALIFMAWIFTACNNRIFGRDHEIFGRDHEIFGRDHEIFGHDHKDPAGDPYGKQAGP